MNSDDSTASPRVVRQRTAGEADGEPVGAWDHWRPSKPTAEQP